MLIKKIFLNMFLSYTVRTCYMQFFLSEVSEAILQNLRPPSEADQGVTGGTLVKLLALGKDTDRTLHSALCGVPDPDT